MRKNKHHHGNLREALIEAGLEMLSKGEELTLRGAAQRAGVSHAAPAHHFDGLMGLRTAIAARAMQNLGDILDKSGRNPAHGPFEQLLDVGLTYCGFAAKRTDLFHVMFVSSGVDRADPAMVEASAWAYSHLQRACAPFVCDDVTSRVLEHAVWSMAHGNAMLRMQDITRNAMAPEPAPSLEAQTRLLLGLPPTGEGTLRSEQDSAPKREAISGKAIPLALRQAASQQD